MFPVGSRSPIDQRLLDSLHLHASQAPLNVREARAMTGLRADEPIYPETGSQSNASSVSISGQRFDLELDGRLGGSCE